MRRLINEDVRKSTLEAFLTWEDLDFFLLAVALVDVAVAAFVMYYGVFVLLTINLVVMTCLFVVQVLRSTLITQKEEKKKDVE